jgi:hypothetical protein
MTIGSVMMGGLYAGLLTFAFFTGDDRSRMAIFLIAVPPFALVFRMPFMSARIDGTTIVVRNLFSTRRFAIRDIDEVVLDGLGPRFMPYAASICMKDGTRHAITALQESNRSLMSNAQATDTTEQVSELNGLIQRFNSDDLRDRDGVAPSISSDEAGG